MCMCACKCVAAAVQCLRHLFKALISFQEHEGSGRVFTWLGAFVWVSSEDGARGACGTLYFIQEGKMNSKLI